MCKSHVVQRLWVGVAAGMSEPIGLRCSRGGRASQSINFLVLGANLGQKNGAMMSDWAAAGRSCETGGS